MTISPRSRDSAQNSLAAKDPVSVFCAIGSTGLAGGRRIVLTAFGGCVRRTA